MSTSLDKPSLRRSLLAHRQAMTVHDWQQASDRLCAHLQASDQLHQAKTVLAYFSIRQEPDLRPLFTACSWIRWGMPRCQGRSLIWHQIDPGDPSHWQAGAYGIPEPRSQRPILDPQGVDLMLIPAVACDRRGYRLGYGGGFYDRLLSQPDWQAIPTLGIVFHHGYLPQLPADPWDRPLQAVCTDQALYSISSID
ncbi:5-formyltetrahydrofolate cyclo-ligase [Leptolyngbya sp. CCY15150]|uniref:5-formyltetrahydrofolate cyclo-ligase n=1 Tax=Leptolyngbya sp. CCY15150 TaxID=2767772 RepID=UPI001EF361DD|nr:5-formyltetrahydrofolate cyclo-ligase [Leptolyngbya sp. CCY15150]